MAKCTSGDEFTDDDFYDSIDVSVVERGASSPEHQLKVDSIVGFISDQHNHAEQRQAARLAVRAEAREVRKSELERQQSGQEDDTANSSKIHAEEVPETAGRRRAARQLAELSPGGMPSPRRRSQDSAEDVFNIKDLRHELKEVERKLSKAMILSAQLDNENAALGYQVELLKDHIEELQDEYAQLSRIFREKCTSHERLRRRVASLERQVTCAENAVRARDAAAAAAGFDFTAGAAAEGPSDAAVSPLALVPRQANQAPRGGILSLVA